MSAVASNHREARKERADATSFKALITTPVTGAFDLPANARVSFMSVAGCSAGTTAATTVGPSSRTIKTPVLAAGGRVVIDRLERGTAITPATGFEVHIDIGLNRWRKIAQGA